MWPDIRFKSILKSLQTISFVFCFFIWDIFFLLQNTLDMAIFLALLYRKNSRKKTLLTNVKNHHKKDLYKGKMLEFYGAFYEQKKIKLLT